MQPERPRALSELTGESAGPQAAHEADAGPRAATRGTPLPKHRRAGKHADEGHELSAASLGSVFPVLAHHLLLVCLIGLAGLTAVNMFGISESAKLLMLPTALFIVSILAVIVAPAPFTSMRARQ